MKRIYNYKILFFLLFSFTFNGIAQIDSLYIKKLIDSGNVFLYSETEKAEKLFNKALITINANNIENKKAIIYERLGTTALIKADYSKALNYHLKSLEINETYKDSLGFANDYHNIALVLRYQKDYEKSITYFKKAIQIRKKLKDTLNLGNSYSMLGVIYRNQYKYDIAKKYYTNALDLFTLINNKEKILHVNGNLATLYYYQKKYKKSNTINLKALEYLKSIDRKTSIASRYRNIGKGFEKLKKYKIAILYLDSAIVIAKNQGYLKRLASNYKSRSINYNYLKNYKQALTDYRLYKKLNDSIFNINKTKEITTKLLETEFSKQQAIDSIYFSEKEKRLEYTVRVEKRKNNLYLLLFIGVIVLAIIMFNFIKQKRNLIKTKLEKEILESELLQQKINVTNNETKRIINEKTISLTLKKNLLSQIRFLINKKEVKSIFKDLNSIIIDLDQQTKTETKQAFFDENMQKLQVEFEKKLIYTYPSLTKTEREICCLILAHLSIKDIVSIKGITSGAVQTARYRIRKKLNLKKGDELQQFLQDFS